LLNRNTAKGIVLGFTLIFTGALGNIIDCAFYGLIFSESTFLEVAKIFPEGGGYGTFLHGKVVDMLYFPIINSHYPEWFPFVGGERFIFFSPVFNIADAYISVGVIYLLLFQHKRLK
jgi:signal peptidase II